jgi:hypothetical protein
MSELRSAQWAVEAIENGTSNASTIHKTLSELDPVSVCFIFRYIREIYSPDNPQSMGVIERMVELTKSYDNLVKMAKNGEKDSICEWFNDTYRIKEFKGRPNDLLALIVEKMES